MLLAVIENAGYEGENVRSPRFKSWREAEAWLAERYTDEEREELHVDIAHWDEAGGFWSYDH